MSAEQILEVPIDRRLFKPTSEECPFCVDAVGTRLPDRQYGHFADELSMTPLRAFAFHVRIVLVRPLFSRTSQCTAEGSPGITPIAVRSPHVALQVL
jgi:hypothetical protein